MSNLEEAQNRINNAEISKTRNFDLKARVIHTEEQLQLLLRELEALEASNCITLDVLNVASGISCYGVLTSQEPGSRKIPGSVLFFWLDKSAANFPSIAAGASIQVLKQFYSWSRPPRGPRPVAWDWS